MTTYPLAERKLVYRVLHAQLTKFPELMDATFLDDLQADLQANAKADGVDIGDHGAWDTWLGNESTPCDVRMAKRFVIEQN